MEKFIKKDRNKPWNIFKKNNKDDKKLDSKSSEKKLEKLIVIYRGPDGGDSSRQRKHWASVPFVGSVQAKLVVEKKRKKEPIYFTDADLLRGEIHSDSLVIKMDIEGIYVEHALVNTKSSVNVLYKEVFENLGINPK